MKKKITFILLAALFAAVSGFAQGKAPKHTLSKQKMEALVKHPDQKAPKQQTARKALQRQTDMTRQQGLRAVTTAHKKSGVKTPRRAPRRAGIITDQPEGKKINYSRSGDAYYSTYFGVNWTQFEGGLGTVVLGADNKVYIKDIISQAGFGSWVEGTINGSQITIQLPQPIGDSGNGWGFLATKVEYSAEEDWYVPSADQTITLNYDAATGAITSTKELQSSDVLIGVIYDDDYTWAGYGDWNIAMEVVTDKPVEAPAGLTTETYSLSAEGFDGSLVEVGFSGNDIYVQGIDPNLPDTWVKGTISGDKVTFANGQYVGADEVVGCHQYLLSATAEEMYDDYYDEYYTHYSLSDTDIEFTYDAATKTLTESTPFLLNVGKNRVYYLYAFNHAELKPFTEVAATPATPVINSLYEGGWDSYHQGYGWGYLDFDILTSDIDGQYILPEKLSYQIYTKVNGEVKPLTISWYDYIYLEEETMTEIPYGFTEDWDFFVSGQNNMAYYYVIGPEAYGVQAIYRGAGEERRSEIAWVDALDLGSEVQPAAATPTYPDITLSADDNRIDYSLYTGEEEVEPITNNYKPETYDVAIHLDDPAMVGTAIESITFPLQEVEGVSDMSVFLTSQLRVEDGKNAADLVVKTVAPAEAGFITVTLDKPYLIPEGGVYVGYSLTITDTNSKANQQPITITDQVNAGGFYLHTSDGFLKWLDVAEGYGGSAMIQVTLAGSAIKGNAACVADGETLFAMTGADITIPLTIVNHGANGIQSADLLYSLNGQSGSLHIDADVDNLFGKSTNAELNLPAIAESGTYELVVTVDKVNGAANEDAVSSTTLPIVVLNTLPKKRTLLEEYTGLWCQWCPRGYVALEKLAELYPDEYVLVSYHNGDDMEILDGYDRPYPSYVGGFPTAYLDRDIEVDPYYGIEYGKKDLGVADDMAQRNKLFGQAEIAFTSQLSDDQETVTINSEIIFPYDLTDGNYAVEYILTADGLQDDNWGQSNAYANGAQGTPLYMDEFTSGGSTIYGLVFNDVAVLTSEMLGGSGNTISEAVADQPVALSYQFTLADALNTSYAPVIQDVNNLKVVVLLIDQSSGAVINANKAKINESATGISIVEMKSGDQGGNPVIYDLTGLRVAHPVKGVYIVNGRKVVVK